MTKILSFLSTLASVIYLFVGFYTYRLNKKTREGLLFLHLNIALSFWSFTYAFVYMAEDIYELTFWYKLSTIGQCFFPVLILLLVATITNQIFLHKPIIKFLIPIPGFVFWVLSLVFFWPDQHTPDIIADMLQNSGIIYSYSYIFLSLFIIYKWGKKTDKVKQKKQAKILLVTGSISLVIDIIYKVIYPFLYHKDLPNITQILILILLWGIYYSIINYNFLLASNPLIINELFNEILDLTFLIDLDGKIIRTNKQVLKLLGMDWIDLVDTKITRLIEESKLDDIISNCEKLDSTVKLNHVFIYTKKGKQIPLNISVSPIRGSNNHILLGLLIVGQDIRVIEEIKYQVASHKKTEEKLRKSEELFRTVAETIPFSIIMARKSDNTILYLNKNAEDLFLIEQDNMVGKSAFEFYKNPQDRNELVKDIVKGKQVREKEIPFKRSNGKVFSGLITTVTAIYNEEEVLLSVVADITEQKAMQQEIIKSEEMLRKLMDSIPDLVAVSDMRGNILYVNKSIKGILGYDPFDEGIPINVLYYLDKEEVETAQNNMKRLLYEELGPSEYKCIKKDGSTIDIEVNSTVLREKSSQPFGYVFVVRDITERKKVQEALKRSKEEIERANNELLKTNYLLHEQSIRDSLTNLYNHRFIMDLLKQEIQRAKQNNTTLCLMMLDIDFFKQINDKHGHQAGDRVLSYVSKLIQLSTRDTDSVGRYGGEEFMILLPETKLSEAYEIAESIRTNIENFNFTKKKLNVTISIGLTEYRSDDMKTLVDRVDELLYRAKEKGRNRIETS